METISQKVISEVAYHLLANASTKYPKHYLTRLLDGLRTEENLGSKSVIVSILENIFHAVEGPASLCQDTGIPTFEVFLTPDISIKGDIESALIEATIRATEQIPIRKNVIEPFSFCNSGNNTGWGTPFVHFHYRPHPGPLRIRAELKGFGGEIKSTTDWVMTSTEDMGHAVLAYVLNSFILSKGENCIPGFSGIGVGGYAAEAMMNAKKAVFRELNEKASKDLSPDDPIRRLEERMLRCVNRLGLGPMGDGGKTTSLGLYIERRGTHTAVVSVAVSHHCWASRASEALIRENKVSYITPHLQKEDVLALRQELYRECPISENKGNVYELNIPLTLEELLRLRVGDIVYLNGTICTSRDRAHRRMVENLNDGRREGIPPEILDNGVIYHCGPVVAEERNGWCIRAAGPTTSSRFTEDASFLVENGVIKVAIGKGTMGLRMIQALKGRGVYLKAVGGCAVTYQKMIQQAGVKWLELGYPEAVWIFKVKRFGPLVVGIDSTGHSLTEKVMEGVYENSRRIYREEGLDPHRRYVQYPQTLAGLSLEEVIEKSRGS